VRDLQLKTSLRLGRLRNGGHMPHVQHSIMHLSQIGDKSFARAQSGQTASSYDNTGTALAA
jgi:hypothetical protein